MRCKNATEAFEITFDDIMINGSTKEGTKYLRNVSFYIDKPTDRIITTPWRKFSKEYAEIEWDWYLSEDRSIKEIGKHASIWNKIADENGLVQSNYGWQWNRNNQLDKIINELDASPESRRAYLSIYDGKEIYLYDKDVPCTLAIGFTVEQEKLCMQVFMRSNDLVYGFCNDQYCFSKLQELVAFRLKRQVGWYYHLAADMHIYEKHWGMKER